MSCLPVSLFREMISGSMTVGEWAAAASRIGQNFPDDRIRGGASFDSQWKNEIASLR